MDPMVVYVFLIIAVALVFDFFNGVKDAANSIATIVATRVLTPRKAVLWAAFFNFVAAFGFEQKVAKNVAEKIVLPEIISPHLIVAALAAAIVWTILCLRRGLPISVSHALIGALTGAGLVRGAQLGMQSGAGALHGGFGAISWSFFGLIAAFIVLSSVLGLVLGAIMMICTLWACRNRTPRGVDRVSRVLQLFSAAAYSMGHGLNDAQKTMGIIVALLGAVPSLRSLAWHGGDPGSGRIAWWIILSCQGAIALGTYMGGWKVVRTLGHRVAKLRPVEGFCAETAGAITLVSLSICGIPVSTTHTITGAIFGVSATRRMSAVRWGVGADIVTAWVLTLPVSGVIAAALYWVMSWFVG